MTDATPQPALQRMLTTAWTRRGWLACGLFPVSLLFGALTLMRRILFRLGLFRSARVPVPVIVVGNVMAGGTGKTPIVIALVQHLQARGLQVGVISRGYGRRSRDCREVHDGACVSDVGDEPALIKRITSASVFVAANRLEAARSLLAQHPATQVIVCDDGLQHLQLQRDIEICVFDDRGIGNGWLLPAGPLREPWPRAVDLVLHTGKRPAFVGFRAQRALADHARRADASRIALADLMHPGAKPVLAVAAIAQPEDFFSMLHAAGLQPARTVSLPDHCDFSGWSKPDSAHCTVVCTEKDAAKLWRHEPDALAVPLLCTLEPAFLARLDALLSALPMAGTGPTLSSRHGHTTS